MVHFLAKGRLIVTAETDPDWMKGFSQYAKDNHEFHLIGDGAKQKSEIDGSKEWAAWPRIEQVQWDVALVDHCPGNFRWQIVQRLKGRCKYVVCHDVEECWMPKEGNPRGYEWEKARGIFKYEFVWREYVPYTMVLSDEAMFQP